MCAKAEASVPVYILSKNANEGTFIFLKQLPFCELQRPACRPR